MITSVEICGVIRGNTIELERSPDLPDGARVTVRIEHMRRDLEALINAFGGWADDPEGLDAFIEQVYRMRRNQWT
jgi:hypothetical protein